ncbi:13269_t:CDS:2, partial [Funneliformis geosporum]
LKINAEYIRMADQYIEVPVFRRTYLFGLAGDMHPRILIISADDRSLGNKISLLNLQMFLRVQGHVIVSESVYEEACIKDVDDGLNKKNILNDQSFRGWRRKRIRKWKIQIIKQAFAQVQGEVPGSPIFIMPLARDARNLEVQVLADRYGNAIHYLEEIVRFKDVIKRSFKRLSLLLQNKRHLYQRKGLLSD